MELKKNPKYDIHRKRGVLLNLGLIVSLILIITAFKWKVAVNGGGDEGFIELSRDGIFVEHTHITDFKSKDAPKPKPIRPVILYPTEFTESVNPPDYAQPPVGPDQGADIDPLSFGELDIPEEFIKTDTFRVVEKMPEPVGGWSFFYNTLSKNIKYPRQAQRVGASGKVFVEFTVNNEGELSRLKIIKGIGYGCDEEAIRVLSLSKWNPGKQRGVPVNVKMVQTITFALKL